jgi:hypothetical protein
MDVASYEQGRKHRREAGDAALTNQMEELKLLDADQAYTRKEDEFSREQTRLDSPIPEEILTAFNKHLARLNKPSMQLKPGVTPRIIESSKVYGKLFETFVDSDKQLDKEAADRAAKKAAVERARKYALDPKTFFDKTTGEEVPGYFDKSAGKYYDADGVPIDTKRYVMKIDKAASIRSTIEAKTEEAQSVSRGTELGKAGGKAQVEKVKAVVNEGIVKDKMVRLMNAYDKADKEGGVGFIGGTKTIAKKTARQSAGPATDRLYNELGFDLAAFMKEISGAAVPDKEVERLSSLMPNIMQSREAFQNSLAVLMQQAIDTAKKYSRENEAIGELGMQQSTNEAPSSERKLPTTATSASKLKDYSKGAGR